MAGVKSAARRLAAALCAGSLLAGCATTPRQAPALPRNVSETEGRALAGEWQRRVTQQIEANGTTDPATLAQLPTLRSQAVLRPGQIVFVAADVDAQFAERDGFDVAGLLLGRRDLAGGSWYIFVVGAVERHEYRPVGVADIRLAALNARDGRVRWLIGSADAAALARYRAAADPTTAVRFPADFDRFRLAACAPAVCAEDIASGARWALYFPPADRDE